MTILRLEVLQPTVVTTLTRNRIVVRPTEGTRMRLRCNTVESEERIESSCCNFESITLNVADSEACLLLHRTTSHMWYYVGGPPSPRLQPGGSEREPARNPPVLFREPGGGVMGVGEARKG